MAGTGTVEENKEIFTTVDGDVSVDSESIKRNGPRLLRGPSHGANRRALPGVDR